MHCLLVDLHWLKQKFELAEPFVVVAEQLEEFPMIYSWEMK